MKKVSYEEFEQYADIEDRLWNMGREFFNEVQMTNPQALEVSPSLCHYDDVYVDGTETLEIGYGAYLGEEYDLFMIELPVKEFLEDHIGAAKLCQPINGAQSTEVFEQLQQTHQEIDNEFANFDY